MRYKKGNVIVDGIFVIVVLFVLAIIALITFTFFTEVNTSIQSEEGLSDESKAVSSTMNTQFPQLFDSIFIFAVVLLWIMALVFSFMIDSHPIFLIFTLILLIFVLIIGGSLANAYEEVSADTDLSVAASNFPMTNFVFNHFLETILVISASIAFALFAKVKMS